MCPRVQGADALVTGSLGLAYPGSAAAMHGAVAAAREGHHCVVIIDVNWRPVFWTDPAAAKPEVLEYIKQVGTARMRHRKQPVRAGVGCIAAPPGLCRCRWAFTQSSVPGGCDRQQFSTSDVARMLSCPPPPAPCSQADILKVTDEEAEWLYGIPRQVALEHPERVLQAAVPGMRGVLVSAGEKGSSYAFKAPGACHVHSCCCCCQHHKPLDGMGPDSHLFV